MTPRGKGRTSLELHILFLGLPIGDSNMEKWGDHQEKKFFIDNVVQGGFPESVLRFGKYAIIEKSTLVQTIAVKTNKTI